MSPLNKRAFVMVAAGALILGGSILTHAQQMPSRMAQNYGGPPADVGSPDAGSGDGGGGNYGGGASGAPSGSSDDASLLVRVDRLEEQVRQLNGQIEQMQFENHKLEDQLRKFQEDVDFRFQENGHGHMQRHSEMNDSGSAAPAPIAPAQPTQDFSSSTPSSPAPTTHASRGDAFDPSTDPNAPGAPQPLGGGTGPVAETPVSPGPSSPDADPNAPLNLPSAGYTPSGVPPVMPASTPPVTSSGQVTPSGTAIASAGVNPVKEEFDVAIGYFKQKDYDGAERSFSAFLEKNPKSRWTSEATYYLGETYFQRSRPREAAEQYLKISTNYASSPRAPEAMLRLGESLQALGAKEQACATFSEVPRKYPNASAAVKAGAEREAKRAQC